MLSLAAAWLPSRHNFPEGAYHFDVLMGCVKTLDERVHVFPVLTAQRVPELYRGFPFVPDEASVPLLPGATPDRWKFPATACGKQTEQHDDG